jgi:hypothetical protein
MPSKEENQRSVLPKATRVGGARRRLKGWHVGMFRDPDAIDYINTRCAWAGGTCVRGNMDSIAILRGAICILQKFLGNMDTSSKQFFYLEEKNPY